MANKALIGNIETVLELIDNVDAINDNIFYYLKEQNVDEELSFSIYHGITTIKNAYEELLKEYRYA